MARQLPDAPKVPTPARDADDIRSIIARIEGIGLLVLDPSDPALVERIKGAIRLASQAGLIQSDSLARAVLAALSLPGGSE